MKKKSGRPPAFPRRMRQILRLVESMDGAVLRSKLVEHYVNKYNASVTTTYDDIKKMISEGVPLFGRIKMKPIAVTKTKRGDIVHLPNHLVGLEALAVLFFIASFTVDSIISLLLSMPEKAIQNAQCLMFLEIPLVYRCFLYWSVRKNYILN